MCPSIFLGLRGRKIQCMQKKKDMLKMPRWHSLDPFYVMLLS